MSDIDSRTIWIENRLRAISADDFDPQTRATFKSVACTDPEMRWNNQPFAAAITAADWACYPRAADRLELSRAFKVIGIFPRGFRLWFCRLKDGTDAPIGYTGWHSIDKEIFDRLHDRPHEITHRGQIIPLNALNGTENYIYLFNYSIVPQLHHTEQSKLLIRTLARDIAAIPYVRGLTAVTVSEDGVRVAKYFGLQQRGRMTHDGDIENVYAVRITAHPTQRPEST